MIEDTELREILRATAANTTLPAEMPQPMRRKVTRRRARAIGITCLVSVGIAIGALQGMQAITLDDAAPIRPVDETRRVIPRANGEVLSFTGIPGEAPGDLVAVNPETGEQRVLVEDLEVVYSARWSADGRWVAYDATGPEGTGLWVVGGSHEPRQVATGRSLYVWSSTGAELATIRVTDPHDPGIAGSTLYTIDPVTGETTDVGSIPDGVGDVGIAPAWSPDGTRFVYGARGGAIYSVDVRSRAHSLLVRLPARKLDSVDQIDWSPDGAHIAVLIAGPGGVYVIDADGSNVRVPPHHPNKFAWSPDGTRLAYDDGLYGVWVTSMDGSAAAKVAPFPARCRGTLSQTCREEVTWSPDGSRIGLRTYIYDGSVLVSAIDADGSGDAERIDELTYRSWDGGSYSCAASPEAHRRREHGGADLVDVGLGLAC